MSEATQGDATNELPVISWTEAEEARSAHWRSEAGMSPPKRVVVADDTISADVAYRLACEGTAILWRGDFQNARQLLQAIARRIDRKPLAKSTKSPKVAPVISLTEAFNKHRLSQSQRARTLGMLLIPFEADFSVPLRRAPDVRQACLDAYGAVNAPFVASLRELLGLIGSHEWHRKGVDVAALGDRIHPHYGVFAPTRAEYINLVAEAPLPSKDLAFDIGTGTGVLAAVLARRGVAQVVATDIDPRALVCAAENFKRLRVNKQATAVQADLFPEGRAPLIVCNPPWVPARPSSPLEHAIYDPESRMLRGFLSGLAEHLAPRGEGWLILSDLAEHLGLRSREELLAMIETAGLEVIGRIETKPNHPKAADAADPLHAARTAEVTSLWRLGVAKTAGSAPPQG